MDLYDLIRYISSLRSCRKDLGFDITSLRILEQFAWEKYLSAYQIWSNLKSTRFKMAYKNINKRINVLFSSGLIEQTNPIGISNKRRTKYYRLTEYGIYQLFLEKLASLQLNQPYFRKGRETSPLANDKDASKNFLHNYGDSALFKIFLYPYFKKETLLAIGPAILRELYEYLSACCHNIERDLESSQLPLLDEHVFSWDRIPGKDEKLLLSHLKEIFNLESIDPYDIKKEDASITVNTLSAPPIVIKLDKKTNKVLVMSTAGGRFKELQYDAHQLGQEMMVLRPIPSNAPTERVLNDAKKRIEQLVYENVLFAASSAAETSKEFSYYCEILSKDDRFMKVVEKIYEDRHKGFERGYKKLRNKS